MRIPLFRRSFFLLTSLCCWAIASAFAAEASTSTPPPALRFPPAAGSTDLATDPAIVAGELPNGLRYALRPNAEPRGRAALRLVVAAGALHETEDQRGLAHYLEHMAFNGSTHYPPGTLIEFFQRLGMDFGGDTNAYTSFDRTVYMLDLPDTKPETLAEGFRVLADYAGHLLLLPEEINRERGVILNEKLARDSADYRTAVAGYEFFYKGTLLPLRLPIGLESVIKEAGRGRFADFYDTWYRPERLAVIAVGDFDPAVLEKPLREAFGPLAARAPARPTPDFGTPSAATAPGLQTGYHYDAEASSTTVAIQVVRPADRTPDSSARRLRELPLELANFMLNQRLSELAKTDSAPFVKASASRDFFPEVFDGAELSLTARPGRWADTLAVGENELRRALRFGFRAPELREAVASYRNALDQAVKTASTRRSEQFADDLVSAFIEGSVPTTPAADLALLGPALDAMTLEDCHEALKAAWSSASGRLVGVLGNTDLGTAEAPAAAIAKAYAAAEAAEVNPPATQAETPWAYADFGPAGSLTSRTEVADLGITQVVFANGVRLNLKRTDFEAGTISLRARVGTGRLEEPRDQPGLAFFAGAAFTAGGLGKHSADDLRRLLAGRNVGVGLQVADDALVFSGQTTPADLALQLQLLTATLADPGYRPEAEVSARRQMEPLYKRLASDPTGPLSLEVPRLLASGDPRFGLPSREDAFARTLTELRTWLAPQLASGAIELSLIGDLDPDATIATVAATLATLPPRTAKPALENLRHVTTPPPSSRTLTVTTTIPKAILGVYWPTTDARDITRTRRLNLLADILGDRLRKTVREELGGSYSPGAASAPSDTYRDYGFLFARLTLESHDVERIRPAVLAAAADLFTNGVTEDELERAKLPVLTAVRESERTNAYWLNAVLGSAQEQPWRLEWARTRAADLAAVTKPELDALARAYLDPARALQFTILPAQSPKPEPMP
jgi:zinc protease